MSLKTNTSNILIGLVLTGMASSAFSNEVISYPKGDQCVISSEIPLENAKYKKRDHKQEAKLCSYLMDLDSDRQASLEMRDVALCPKLFSSSPAVEVFKIPEATSKSRIQNQKCNWRVGGKTRGFKKLAKYKYGIAGQSISSMMRYYHISRALRITSVPVSVFRTLNRETHLEVAERGAAKNNEPGSSLGRYWTHISQAFSGKVDTRFVKRDGSESFGAISENPTGEQKYYEDFWPVAAQKKGITKFKSTRTYKRLGLKKPASSFIGTRLSDENLQEIQALKDASNMLILDSIFGQGDRFGNIHAYHIFMTPQEDGSLKKLTLKDVSKMIKENGTDTEKANLRKANAMPNDWKKEIVPRNAKLVRIAKSFLNRMGIKHAHAQEMLMKDNDAGLVNKVNPFKERSLIEGVHHVNQSTFEQLVKLYTAVKNGELDAFLVNNLLMDRDEKSRFVEGLTYVTENLLAKQRRGQLFQDLNVKRHFTDLNPVEAKADGLLEVIKSGVRVRTHQVLTLGKTDQTLFSSQGQPLFAGVGDLLEPLAESALSPEGTPFTKVKVIKSKSLPRGAVLYIWTEAVL